MMKVILAIMATLLLSSCCSGTQEGMFFVGHALCPQEWAQAHRTKCNNDCYEAAINKIGHDDANAAYTCQMQCR